MDDDYEFDDSVFQAMDRLESSYKSQAANTGIRPRHSEQANLQQPATHQQHQQAGRQPMQQINHTNNSAHSIWGLFSSLQPSSTAGDVTSVCSGWATRRHQRPRYGAGPKAPAYAPQHKQQQQQQQWGAGQQRVQQQPHHEYPHHGSLHSAFQPQPQQQLRQQAQTANAQNWDVLQHQHQVAAQQPGQWQLQQPLSQYMQISQQQVGAQQHLQQPGQWQQQHESAGQRQGSDHQQAGNRQAVGLNQGSGQVAASTAGSFDGHTVGQQHGNSTPAAAGASGSCGGHSGMADVRALPNAAQAAGQQQGAMSGPIAGCSGTAAAGGNLAASAAGTAPGSAPAANAAGVSGGAAAAASGGPARSAALCVYSAKLHLGPKGMMEVEFSGYHQDISSICGSIPGAKQVGDRWSRKWHIPLGKVQQLEAQLIDGPTVRVPKFEQLADIICKFITAARKYPDDSERFSCLSQLHLAPGESLEQRMMPFQREGVKFGLRAGGRVLIGDEMGLGKTVQACALAMCYQDQWPALVVTPSSLRLSWQAALYDWIRVVEDRVLVVLKKTDMNKLSDARTEEEARAMYDFVVVSYDMLKDLHEVLDAMNFDLIILDESHCIKNPTAQRTKLALPLVKKAKHCIMLSGTPALSRPTELFTQLQGLIPKAGLTKKAFDDRYAVYSNYGNFPKLVGSKNEDELNKLLTSTVMIRRKKQEVLKDLPAKLRKQVLLMLPPAKRKELDALKQKLGEVRQLTADIHGVGHEVGGGLLQGMQQQQRNMIMELYHATATIKSDAAAEYVSELLATSNPDDKFLVFAFHSTMMDAIEKAVSDEKRKKDSSLKHMKFMRIDGSTPAQQRQRNVEQFQEDENCRLAILNIKAAGVGLTLTRASTVVFAELAWTPSEVQQAEDRAHRIGQTSCVNVQLLLVKDSIDEIMWELLQNKLATTGQVLDGHKDRMEVDKSAQHRTKGGWTPTQLQENQGDNQPTIKDFFGAASKKQRLS